MGVVDIILAQVVLVEVVVEHLVPVLPLQRLMVEMEVLEHLHQLQE